MIKKTANSRWLIANSHQPLAISYPPLAISHKLFREAKNYLVGGVNSPVRSFKAVGGYPIFIKEANGSKIYSQDAREFIDYCMGFGALILGHSNPLIIKALKEIIKKGTCFGANTKLEIELAKLIIEAIPSIEKIRFTNSGTEAVMSAIRLARAYTKKDKIIKFKGSYHGHIDYLLDCPGVPFDFKKDTIVLPYNDINKIKKFAKKYQKKIAAIIVEPVCGNMGLVLPKDGFLKTLREICDKYNFVLIFDEVITGFRLTYGSAQKLFGVEADLTCLGKIIGGGLPVGAFGGRNRIMKLLAPEGKVYQAGTFSGNPLTTTAGFLTLKILLKENPYRKLEEMTKRLCESIREIAERFKVKLKINYIGSMFSIFFTDKEVIDYNTAKNQDLDLFKRFYYGLLSKGIYLSPSGFEVNFLSTSHKKEDIIKTEKAIKVVFKNLKH